MLKNLSTCNPREFLVQTNKIRVLAKEFVESADIVNWKKNLITEEVKKAEASEREGIVRSNILKEFDRVLEILMDKDVDKTISLLCYCCFIDPAEQDKYRMAEILESITSMIADPSVIGFFTSLVGLTQTITSKGAKE